ncbi:MAG: DUF1599 domain-containing protein [Bacteroidetes bacterium]|nr:DUF1599 domain-containing protein [Bacteroidota bacterium]
MQVKDTIEQYEQVIHDCKDIFIKKTKDYGTSWRVYRTISIADQIYIKAKRIRTIQEKGEQRIGDTISSEFRGILNYGIIGMMQLQLETAAPEELDAVAVGLHYNRIAEMAKALMLDKNHDYGEAWREMSQESFVDLILSKLQRIRQIIGNEGKTLISEGIDANFLDIINYAVFALILIGEGKHEA